MPDELPDIVGEVATGIYVAADEPDKLYVDLSEILDEVGIDNVQESRAALYSRLQKDYGEDGIELVVIKEPGIPAMEKVVEEIAPISQPLTETFFEDEKDSPKPSKTYCAQCGTDLSDYEGELDRKICGKCYDKLQALINS